jgi:plastocyanin
MANISIPVSIDALGNITCPDETVAVGDTVTWAVTWATAQGSITVGPATGKASPFTTITAPGRTNSQWSATVRSAGEYNIADSGGKQKSPKIAILTPMLEKK